MDTSLLPTESEPVTVVEGDCLKVLPELDPNVFAAVLTDPPYGIALGTHATGACMDGSARRRRRSWVVAGDDSLEVAGRVFEWADAASMPLCAFASPYKIPPGPWRNLLAWDKGPAVGGGGDPATCWKRTFEMICVRNNRPLRAGRDSAVLRYPTNNKSAMAHHPCQKPVELMRYLIRQLTAPGDLILDPFAGSGTTGEACLLEGRRCLLIEKEPAYAAICRARVAEALGKGKGSLFATA